MISYHLWKKTAIEENILNSVGALKRLINETNYNGRKLFDGTFNIDMRTGIDMNSVTNIKIPSAKVSDIMTAHTADMSLLNIDGAVIPIGDGKGASSKSLDFTFKNLAGADEQVSIDATTIKFDGTRVAKDLIIDEINKQYSSLGIMAYNAEGPEMVTLTANVTTAGTAAFVTGKSIEINGTDISLTAEATTKSATARATQLATDINAEKDKHRCNSISKWCCNHSYNK